MATCQSSVSIDYDGNGKWFIRLITKDNNISIPIEYPMGISNEVDFINFLKGVLNEQKDNQRIILLEGIINELEGDIKHDLEYLRGGLVEDTEFDS